MTYLTSYVSFLIAPMLDTLSVSILFKTKYNQFKNQEDQKIETEEIKVNITYKNIVPPLTLLYNHQPLYKDE